MNFRFGQAGIRILNKIGGGNGFAGRIGAIRACAVLCGAITILGVGTPSRAEPVRQACLDTVQRSERENTCKCIQVAADATLSPDDQKRAAILFKTPEVTQDLRTSKDRQERAFWTRYTAFAKLAEAFCES